VGSPPDPGTVWGGRKGDLRELGSQKSDRRMPVEGTNKNP